MSDSDSLVGTQLGKYEVTGLIGKGGMATVYEAVQTPVNRRVAVKVLPRYFTHDDMFMLRFRREAEVVAHLEHLHILPVYDYGEYEGMPYLVMRYLDGGSLRQRIKEGWLPWQDVVRITTQIAGALDHAHSQNVIHRDVKPGNILLDRHGNAFLADFGLSKMVESVGGVNSSSVVGTPSYMAPEAITVGKSMPSMDIYGLGITLYETLTGQVPYPADTPIAQIMSHVQRPVPSLRARVPWLPEDVEMVVQRAMAKRPDNRYETAGAFAAALTEAALKTDGWEADVDFIFAPRNDDQEPSPFTVLEVPENNLSDDTVSSSQPSIRAMIMPVAIILILAVVGVGVRFSPLWGTVIGPREADDSPLATSTQNIAAARTTEPADAAPSTEAVAGVEEVDASVTDQPTATSEATSENADSATPLPDVMEQRGQLMRVIGEGEFRQGSRVASTDERPEHDVFLSVFYLDNTEVTNTQYAECVTAGACVAPEVARSRTRTSYYGEPSFADHPVINIQWAEAQAYCRWRDAHLPTEAQWEKAAAWDPESGSARSFPWGTDELSHLILNWAGSGLGDTVAVGQYPDGASAYGVLDMAGNVSEWVADWYDAGYYSIAPYADPVGPESGTLKVYRGGSFNDFGGEQRLSERRAAEPALRSPTIGFRCAWTPTNSSGNP